jgi:hypothetical protein
MGIDEDLIQNGMFIPPPMPLNVYIYGDASADSLKPRRPALTGR